MCLSPATNRSLPCGAGKAELPPVRNSSLAMGRMPRPQPATGGLPRPTRGRSGWLLQEGPSVLPFASSGLALRPAPCAEKAKRIDREGSGLAPSDCGVSPALQEWLAELAAQSSSDPAGLRGEPRRPGHRSGARLVPDKAAEHFTDHQAVVFRSSFVGNQLHGRPKRIA